MKKVWQRPRKGRYIYECDFCNKRTVKASTMAKHENMCYYNPERTCPMCDGNGKMLIHWDETGSYYDDCPLCKKADKIVKDALGFRWGKLTNPNHPLLKED